MINIHPKSRRYVPYYGTYKEVSGHYKDNPKSLSKLK